MDLKLRSDVMQAKDSKILYLARNLVCTGLNYFDTGFAPFSSENINKDFKITIRLSKMKFNVNQAVVIGCKYEGTLDNLSWPGFVIRRTNNKSLIEMGGYNYYANITPAMFLNKNIQMWRKNGVWNAIIDGQTQKDIYVRTTTFDQNIVIGAGEQTNHTKFRYSTCNIDYVRIEYI